MFENDFEPLRSGGAGLLPRDDVLQGLPRDAGRQHHGRRGACQGWSFKKRRGGGVTSVRFRVCLNLFFFLLPPKKEIYIFYDNPDKS